jgi:UDP-N-acetylglucosamine--N-acetylmuramyl-(pentapeptide) pyrophosphoryl-undecaprenol N-acetylglucosamine transferase
MSRPLKIIISGGGTGGHIFPAIAIADALKHQNDQIDILFVGAKGKMEMEKVPAAGYPIEGLWISGFQRRLTLQNLLFPFKLLSSLWKAKRIINRFKPDMALGVGGYASGPLLQVACNSGIKTAIQEQNAFPGATNRILSKQVDLVFTAYPGMEKYFPGEKVRYLGNPVRKVLAETVISPGDARNYFGLHPSTKTILIFGGSLGAGVLNQTMDGLYDQVSNLKDIQFIWQTGSYYEEMYRDSATGKLSQVVKKTFLEQMEMAYAAADLVVCRAGALTIAELTILGKPSILIPSPNVAEDHQTKNAKALESAGASICLKESDIDLLFPLMTDLVQDAERLHEMGVQAKNMAMPNAADQIAIEILKFIR